VWKAFVATAGEPGDLCFLTEHLKELMLIEDEIGYPETADPAESSYVVDRVTLRQLLLAGLGDVVHFDKKFERYERSPEGKVTAFFADGTSATGDVLVGADGASSKVRGQYLPQARRIETEAIGVGLKLPLTYQTKAWLPPRLMAGMNMVIASAPYFLFTSVFDRRSDPVEALSGIGGEASGLRPELLVETTWDYQSYILCAFVAHRDAYPPGVPDLDRPGLQRVVEAMIAGWHPQLRRLVAESDPDSVMPVRHGASVPVAAWESTNVTLIGDAIHSMPPVGGLGGNTALRDANLLCRTLRAVHCGEEPLLPAVHGYEAEMLDYGFAAVRTALRSQRRGLHSNRIAVAGAKTWFRVSNAVPLLKRKNLPYVEQARKRTWERGPSIEIERAATSRDLTT
jgi:2-polyprenyl-6-methoxyphenol hydroxylase-like FAD-dependent oxidoreductase